MLLEDLRCDGSGHDGCQAGCRIYWKEAWLRRVDSAGPATTADAGGDGLDKLEQLASAGTRTVREDGTPVYRCQATEALRASERMSNWDLAQYVRELRAGNAGPLRLLRVSVRAVAAVLVRGLHLPGIRRRILGLAGHQSRNELGAGAERPAQPKLDLRPGDTVEVRSREEIVATLDARGKTRGLWFDPEMVPYCGRQYRVQERVEQIIDERTGEMIRIPSDCLILKGVVCSGDHSPGRWLCPREIYPYWREAWLRRVEDG